MIRIACIIETDCPNAYSGHRNNKWYTPQHIIDNKYFYIFSRVFSTVKAAQDYIHENCKYPEKFSIVCEEKKIKVLEKK